MEIKKAYSNDDVKVIWEPSKCSHSGICAKNLRKVFDPSRRPWVDMTQASSETIIEQVKACPSGALSYELLSKNKTNENQDKSLSTNKTMEENKETEPKVTEVIIRPNGPVFVKGPMQITHSDERVEMREGNASFCRCGLSANKPFCDGTHKKMEWKE